MRHIEIGKLAYQRILNKIIEADQFTEGFFASEGIRTYAGLCRCSTFQLSFNTGLKALYMNSKLKAMPAWIGLEIRNYQDGKVKHYLTFEDSYVLNLIRDHKEFYDVQPMVMDILGAIRHRIGEAGFPLDVCMHEIAEWESRYPLANDRSNAA